MIEKLKLSHKLMAIFRINPEQKDFWLMDVSGGDVNKVANNAQIQKAISGSVTIFIDAKDQIKNFCLESDLNLRPICLTTIKKLISKNIHEPLKLPLFNDGNEALAWLKKILLQTFDNIEKKGIKDLAALECQLIPAVVAMEKKGIPFNKSKWLTALEGTQRDIGIAKEKLNSMLTVDDGFALFGPQPIDLNNAHEVKKALENLLNVRLKGTSKNHLSKMDHEAVRLLLDYRERSRLMNTYGQTLLKNVSDGRLRGNFIPIGSPSGRFACQDTNLLALPGSPLFQACLSPKPGRKIIRLDYGAFELRILAALSQDQALLKLFNDGQDIHSNIGQEVFKTPVSRTKNSHLRDQAKLLNFGIIYGMTHKTLAKKLDVNPDQAQQLLNNYFKKFSRVAQFLKDIEDKAKKNGYVATALGRRIYLHDTDDPSHVMRLARNAPIQGTGADIVKLALCRTHKKLSLSDYDAFLINVVHDELVVETNEDQLLQVSKLVKEEMENSFLAILNGVCPEVSAKLD